jgi:hypothetical protein
MSGGNVMTYFVFSSGVLKECEADVFYGELATVVEQSNEWFVPELFEAAGYSDEDKLDVGVFNEHIIWSKGQTKLYFIGLDSNSAMCVRVDSLIDELEFWNKYYKVILEVHYLRDKIFKDSDEYKEAFPQNIAASRPNTVEAPVRRKSIFGNFVFHRKAELKIGLAGEVQH